jgi:hypothetical protein
VVAVGEWSPRENRTTRRRHGQELSETKNRRYACRLFRMNSLKEGAMLRVHPLLGNRLVNSFPRRQLLGKQSVARLATLKEAVFSMSSAPLPALVTDQ